MKRKKEKKELYVPANREKEKEKKYHFSRTFKETETK